MAECASCGQKLSDALAECTACNSVGRPLFLTPGRTSAAIRSAKLWAGGIILFVALLPMLAQQVRRLWPVVPRQAPWVAAAIVVGALFARVITRNSDERR